MNEIVLGVIAIAVACFVAWLVDDDGPLGDKYNHSEGEETDD